MPFKLRGAFQGPNYFVNQGTEHKFIIGNVKGKLLMITTLRVIKENKAGGTCGTHGRGEEIVKGLMGKPEGKRSLGRSRRRWEDGIRMDQSGWGM
jgi:hypothetical protein